jgi:hypothetical protein
VIGSALVFVIQTLCGAEEMPRYAAGNANAMGETDNPAAVVDSPTARSAGAVDSVGW